MKRVGFSEQVIVLVSLKSEPYSHSNVVARPKTF